MNRLENRVGKLEGLKDAGKTVPAFDCEKHAQKVMEEMRRDDELRESMSPEEYAAHRRECMEKAPPDTPLGRMRELLQQIDSR